MALFNSWWARAGAVLGAAVLAVLAPMTAWASAPPAEGTVEAARQRWAGGFFSWICCLIVVGLVVLALLIMRRRRSGRR